MAIKSFRDKRLLEILHQRRTPKGFPADLVKNTRRKLIMLDAAASLDDLRKSPANRLHALVNERDGQYAISVNDQFRLCFVWTGKDVEQVEFVDYH